MVAQLVKNLPAMQKTPVRFLGQKDPLEKIFSGGNSGRESAGVQPRLIQGIQRGDGVSGYLFIYSSKI